ncbi:hypothetical protein [Microlunatus parietis]|uniref:Uncharacterized protein n=1 Tax=Microlunatus parietis TaxID=682979 RepID=A0A7Y9LE13_9ACTN|nr:hypothetical protein [Microlunatus parietis]NYE73348.1 hypothetical protein [Microlunatus parietis]
MASTKAERRQQLADFEKRATRIAVGLVIAGPVLGIAAIFIGSAEIFPYEYTVTVALTAMLAPIGLALLIGAVGGLYLIGGWRVAPFGLVFVAGFAALVYGIVVADPWWRQVGVGLLAVSGLVIFLAGTASAKTLPSPWPVAAVTAAGGVIAIVGLVTDLWPVHLFGAMAAACPLGMLIGILRRSS